MTETEPLSSQPRPQPQPPQSEERALYVILVIVGAMLVSAAIAARGAADTGATFGLGCLALAMLGIGSQVRAARRERLPDARVRR